MLVPDRDLLATPGSLRRSLGLHLRPGNVEFGLGTGSDLEVVETKKRVDIKSTHFLVRCVSYPAGEIVLCSLLFCEVARNFNARFQLNIKINQGKIPEVYT